MMVVEPKRRLTGIQTLGTTRTWFCADSDRNVVQSSETQRSELTKYYYYYYYYYD